jgi:FdhD protein
MTAAIVGVPVGRLDGPVASDVDDFLAVEAPLEIRLGSRSFAVTMRTPGNDLELAAGFLFSENVILSSSQIRSLAPLDEDPNIVSVQLEAENQPGRTTSERKLLITSACGVCGKSSLEDLASNRCPLLPGDGLRVDPRVIYQLADRLRRAQAVFDSTGGIHAAALFTAGGDLMELREDVGRHNAVDKLIGAALLNHLTPLKNSLMLVSGRASFELVQKALMAGIPILAAVGAPSSLAVSTAERCGMTLIGFLRNGRFNVYTHRHRIIGLEGLT